MPLVRVLPKTPTIRRWNRFIAVQNKVTPSSHQGNLSSPLLLLPNQTVRWAGHNKWSKIKHKKGAKDLNRNKLVSKATKAIRVASKACGGDTKNLHLQSAIQAAKAIQVPKDRIEDAIQNIKANSSEAEVVSQRYDGHVSTSSGKVAVIVLALTDNKNRTAANLRMHFRKSDGDLLNTGANDWFFDHLGVALVKKQYGDDQEGAENDSSAVEPLSEEMKDKMMECALEGGAVDVDFGDDTDEHVLLKCEPVDLHPLVKAMQSGGYSLSEFESAYLTKDENDGGATIELGQDSTEHFETFLQKMDDDEDVNKIYHNASLFNT